MIPVLRLYPRSFRDRYGDEIELLLESSPTPRRDLLNLFWHALLDRAEYALSANWRRAPRLAGYLAVWLLGAYALGYLADHTRTNIIKLVIVHSPVPGLDSDIFQMRLLTAVCVAALAVVAFFLGRRYWRGSTGSVIAALALVNVVADIVRVDAYTLDNVQVRIDWSWFGWTVAEQALWALLSIACLTVALRRPQRPGRTAILCGTVVVYANSVLMTAVVDSVYGTVGNPWTSYWESIMGGWFSVTAGQDFIVVPVNGWWSTLATALVLGCSFAARKVPATAHSLELVS
jgi:hypothetical protein